MLCFSAAARRFSWVSLCLCLLPALPALAQRALWAETSATAVPRQRAANLRSFRSVTFQLNAVRSVLRAAPAENSPAEVGPVLTLPLPDGRAGRFRVVAVPVMAPALAARYPAIRTYAAQGLDDPTATARLDVSPAGLHAQILSAAGTSYIDPAAPGDDAHYLVFDHRAMRRPAGFACQVVAHPPAGLAPPPLGTRQRPNGAQLRTYRLALACTGEYAATKGGTVAGALAAMVTSINRVNGIYERELAIRLVLVPQTDTLIFLNAATDPYTDDDGRAMLAQNQATVTARIGAANYDVGHVFGTGGGGIADRGSVCLDAYKAEGVTGAPNPADDAFDVDYVAHELGHQFGAEHTFNSVLENCGGGNRAAESAYEPGSGSTIMAYAGICGADNLQPSSDPYFHSRSYDQILAYLATTACATTTATGNQPPAVEAGAHYRVPLNTPFTLTGAATDPDGDALTYAWEEHDLGPAGSPEAPRGEAPIFRARPPTTAPSRTFPHLPDLLSNTTTKGELLPTYARRLLFRLVARDNRPGGGGVDYDTASVSVVGTAGPFRVTAPVTAAAWLAGVPQQVTWAVARTTAAPIRAAAVDILLSTDGGLTFPTVLAAATANDGCATVRAPAGTSTARARIKVQATGNIFFALSPTDFLIQPVTGPTFALTTDCRPAAALTVCPQSSATLPLTLTALGGFTGSVALSSSDLPAGVRVTFPAPTAAVGTTVLAIISVGTGATAGAYPLTLTGRSGGLVRSQEVRLVVPPFVARAAELVGPVQGAPAAEQPVLRWQPVPNAAAYEVQVATDVAFANVVAAQTVAATDYQPTTLLLNRPYFWRVRGTDSCGAGPYSAPASFRPVATECAAYPVTTAVPLAAGQTRAQSTVAVAATAPVAAVRVRSLALSYPDLSQLTLTLTSPTGQRAILFSPACPGASSLIASFDPQATAPLSCPPAAGATYQPAGSLAALLGGSAQGTWTLTVAGSAPFAAGQLTGWTLEICTIPAAAQALPVALNAGLEVYPNPSPGAYQLVVDNGQAGAIPLRVTDALGRTVVTRTLTKTAALLAYSLDLTNLASGAYWLQLTLPTGPVVVRLLRI